MDSTDSSAVAAAVAPEDRWCTTCKHCGSSSTGDIDKYKCFAPQNPYKLSRVNGTRVYDYPSCAYHRGVTNADSCCGEEGKWWEQAPPKPAYTAPSPVVSAARSTGMDLSLPDVNKDALAAKLAAARKPKAVKSPVGTDLIVGLGDL